MKRKESVKKLKGQRKSINQCPVQKTATDNWTLLSFYYVGLKLHPLLFVLLCVLSLCYQEEEWRMRGGTSPPHLSPKR